MHFRFRKNIVQVVRTTYDPATKGPRTEIVGRLLRSDPKAAPELLAACTAEEAEEVQRWIGTHLKADAVAVEHAARSLAGQIAKAAEWFSVTDDLDSAHLVVAEIHQQWSKLRAQLRRRGLLD
jgi:hypothetical protein